MTRSFFGGDVVLTLQRMWIGNPRSALARDEGAEDVPRDEISISCRRCDRPYLRTGVGLHEEWLATW
jgi:hypothetical protein